MGDFNWNDAQAMLDRSYPEFSGKYNDINGDMNVYPLNKVSFTNKHGVMLEREGWFDFSFSVGQRLVSKEPKCFQGVHMVTPTPTCDLKCSGRECFLKGPADPNTGKRRLVAADGRPEVSEATPSQFEKRFLQKLAGQDVQTAQYVPGYPNPLNIPTRQLNPALFNIPEKLLQ